MKKQRKLNGGAKMGFLFALPAAIYMMVFIGYPMIQNLILSFKNVDVYSFAQPQNQMFVGLQNYIELFTSGSLDAFAHESNVDVNNRMIVYDIMDLGKQLKTMGLLVITDAMLNRVTENWKKGKRTHIFLDEFHVVFENEYSGAFFNSA